MELLFTLNYAWILSSVLVCFFNENQSFKTLSNFFVLRIIQGVLLSHYFISGLWKFREIFSADFKFSLKEIVIENVAFSLTGQHTHLFMNFLLHEYSGWLSFGYVCVLLFQIMALTPIFFNRYFKLYGILAVFFHFSTGFLMNIYFYPTVLAVIFFLIIAESLREDALKEEKTHENLYNQLVSFDIIKSFKRIYYS